MIGLWQIRYFCQTFWLCSSSQQQHSSHILKTLKHLFLTNRTREPVTYWQTALFLLFIPLLVLLTLPIVKLHFSSSLSHGPSCACTQSQTLHGPYELMKAMHTVYTSMRMWLHGWRGKCASNQHFFLFKLYTLKLLKMRVGSIFHITKRKQTPKITFHISEVSTTGKLNNPQCANLQKQKEKLLSLAQ